MSSRLQYDNGFGTCSTSNRLAMVGLVAVVLAELSWVSPASASAEENTNKPVQVLSEFAFGYHVPAAPREYRDLVSSGPSLAFRIVGRGPNTRRTGFIELAFMSGGTKEGAVPFLEGSTYSSFEWGFGVQLDWQVSKWSRLMGRLSFTTGYEKIELLTHVYHNGEYKEAFLGERSTLFALRPGLGFQVDAGRYVVGIEVGARNALSLGTPMGIEGIWGKVDFFASLVIGFRPPPLPPSKDCKEK
ncbi:MAG: hypothetical protein V2A73_05745 [Pseudomonadota bacterium]